jgi:small subunit ribosomal protein S21
MLIVEIKNGENIEKSLKTLKSKVIKTKQNQILFERKEFKKKSVLKRTEILKAKYIQSIKDQSN